MRDEIEMKLSVSNSDLACCVSRSGAHLAAFLNALSLFIIDEDWWREDYLGCLGPDGRRLVKRLATAIETEARRD